MTFKRHVLVHLMHSDIEGKFLAVILPVTKMNGREGISGSHTELYFTAGSK